jgi:phosphoglycerate kinase
MSNSIEGIKSIEDVDVSGKTVLVRADLNVPMEGGVVTDTTRIDRFVPTVKLLVERGAKVVIMSHFGRPKGQRDKKFSLNPVAEALAQALGQEVKFASDCVGEVAEKAVWSLQPGEVLMLENLRFYPGETEDDENFARRLAVLGDIYVNDAFSVSHRAHASVHAITRFLPSYAGLNLMKELKALSAALDNPDRPAAALVGGAKVSTKITVLENLLPVVDQIIVGGGMANTFLLALGYDVGKSLCEPDFVDTAKQVMAKAEENNCEIVLPSDATCAKEFKAGAEAEVCALDSIPSDSMILDIGPQSIADLKVRLQNLKTLLWNGPLGAFEVEPFDKGTVEIARAAAELTKAGKLTTVAGGGDTVAALNVAGVTDDFTYVSTAGGAFLEWLEGKELPGVAALKASTA